MKNKDHSTHCILSLQAMTLSVFQIHVQTYPDCVTGVGEDIRAQPDSEEGYHSTKQGEDRWRTVVIEDRR